MDARPLPHWAPLLPRPPDQGEAEGRASEGFGAVELAVVSALRGGGRVRVRVRVKARVMSMNMCVVTLTLLCVCCTMIPANHIGDEGAKALVPALQHLSHLTTLNLRGE